MNDKMKKMIEVIMQAQTLKHIPSVMFEILDDKTILVKDCSCKMIQMFMASDFICSMSLERGGLVVTNL